MTAIPFNRPTHTGAETAYVAEVLSSGRVCGDGPFGRRCQSLLEDLFGGARVLLTTSCTHALEMAAILLDIKAGDEVIVPSFTFVSTANAFVLRGARPRFADVCPDTLNIDPESVRSLLSERTRAVVPVHYAGVGCDMDALRGVLPPEIAIVEDNAHGLFGRYKGQLLGTFGVLATQSFHETKNLSCGEGGAIVINDPSLVERAEIIREKGTNRARFIRGQIDKYSWVDIGSSYVLSDILAALLLAQLEEREKIQKARRAIWDRYDAELRTWASRRGARGPAIPADREQSYHMYYLLMPTPAERQALIEYLKSHGITSVFHYVPLHGSDFGRAVGGRPGDCPVAEDCSERLLRLPFYTAMTEEEQTRVIEAVHAF